MITFNNVTFVIPFYMDSTERGENLYITLNYLMHNIDAEFILSVQYKNLDDAAYISDFLRENFPSSIKILELIQNTPCHKTKLTNMGTFEAKNDIIVLYDLDVLIDINQLKNAIDYMTKNSIDYIFPYTNPEYYIPFDIKPLLFDYKNINLDDIRSKVPGRISSLPASANETEVGYAPGLCVIYTKKSYIESGCDNEGYVGACAEDCERIWRYVHLGFKCERFNGDIFHINHPRMQVDNEQTYHNENLNFYLNVIKKMNLNELTVYFNNNKEKMLEKYYKSK